MNITHDLSDPQAFLDAYSQWTETFDERVQPTLTCSEMLYSYWLCCEHHRVLRAESAVLHVWAEYFDWTYFLIVPPLRKGPQLLSQRWFERFCKETGIALPSSLQNRWDGQENSPDFSDSREA